MDASHAGWCTGAPVTELFDFDFPAGQKGVVRAGPTSTRTTGLHDCSGPTPDGERLGPGIANSFSESARAEQALAALLARLLGQQLHNDLALGLAEKLSRI